MDVTYPPRLAALISEFVDLPRQDRIDLLLEFARELPPVPEHLLERDGGRRPVHECQTDVGIYVEREGDRVRFYIDVAEEAPTIAAVGAVLSEACAEATPAEILAVPDDIALTIIGPEMVGQRRFGLAALVRHIKAAVAELA